MQNSLHRVASATSVSVDRKGGALRSGSRGMNDIRLKRRSMLSTLIGVPVAAVVLLILMLNPFGAGEQREEH